MSLHLHTPGMQVVQRYARRQKHPCTQNHVVSEMAQGVKVPDDLGLGPHMVDE